MEHYTDERRLEEKDLSAEDVEKDSEPLPLPARIAAQARERVDPTTRVGV